MASEYAFYLTGRNIRVFMQMGRSAVKELIGGPRQTTMMENGKMESNMEREYFMMKMGLRRGENGQEEFTELRKHPIE